MLVVVLVDGKRKTQKKRRLLSSTYCLFAIRNAVTPAARSPFRIPHFLSPLATGKPMRWLQ
jgi:hypothetical protein